jgi:uncharacterized coiled-coil protein SlyX
MYHPIQLTIRIPSLTTSKNGSPSRLRFFLIPVAVVLACFTLSPTARAVDPPPDGGYPNGNTAEGENALFNLDTRTGSNNTANGAAALFSNTEGRDNTATGADALSSNTGSSNTATGALALEANTTGDSNTASGYLALFSNTTGSFNVANGVNALFANSTGNNNVANGFQALNGNTIGFANTAIGVQALFSNTTGSGNTANGLNALYNNTTGTSNIALGVSAGFNLTTGNNNIDIGNFGVAGESKKIRIGTPGTHNGAYVAGIYGVTASRGVAVFIEPTGHLGTTTSSARFKEQIKPMEKASEAILALEPVTFRYKHELDPEGIPQFGLVAEDVAKVNRELVAFDEEGKPYTVRYEAVNAMLLNEFLKEHRKVEEQVRANQEQQANIAELNSAVAAQRDKTKALEVMLAEQAAQIRKVSAQLAASDQSALRIVANDQSTTK